MSFDSSSHSASKSTNNKRSRLSTLSDSRNASSLKNPSKKSSSSFTDFGSYMVEKNRKLREQFDANASTSTKNGIFNGVSIFVDGFTVPSSQELKGYMMSHGGRFENYFSRQRVTHIICSNLPDSKMKNFRAFSRGLPVVKPAWILECLVANNLLSWVPYQLCELVNESGKQQKLSSFFTCKSISSSTDTNNAEHPCAEHDVEGPDATNQLLLPVEDNFSNCKMQDDDESVLRGHERDCEEENMEAKFTDLDDEHSIVEASDSNPYRLPDVVSGNDMDTNNCSATKFRGIFNQRHSTLGDPNFVENYFKIFTSQLGM